ncbi:MAG TPA: septum formation initiator family protein [Acidimicrobiales bacterium]|nr:septum formation initiator family protein [Acidimicrobiales bacterium]
MAETQLLARLSHRLGHAARALPLPGSRPGTKKRVDTPTRPGRHEVRRAEGRGPGTRRGGTRRSRIRRGAAAPPRSRVARRQAAKVRRTRAALAGTALLSALILVGWFPAASLLHQRAAISASAAELTRLQREDAALTQEQQALGSPAEIARLARERYQLVNPGEQAFEVLPPAGKSGLASYSGDPGNQPVVSPSSASELPPGSGAATTGGGSTSTNPSSAAPTAGSPANGATGGNGANGTGSTGSTGSTATASNRGPSGSPGFLGRIGQTLEFWR